MYFMPSLSSLAQNESYTTSVHRATAERNCTDRTVLFFRGARKAVPASENLVFAEQVG